jgi:hypothetical protein
MDGIAYHHFIPHGHLILKGGMDIGKGAVGDGYELFPGLLALD